MVFDKTLGPMWQNTTKSTARLLLNKMRFNRRFNNRKNWSDTFESTTFTKWIFHFILFIFYTLFCSLSENELGREDVPFVVMGHIWKMNEGSCVRTVPCISPWRTWCVFKSAICSFLVLKNKMAAVRPNKKIGLSHVPRAHPENRARLFM